MSSKPNEVPDSKTSWFSFSLRSLLIGTAVFAVVFGLFYHFYLGPVLAERALFAKVDELGGKTLESDHFLFVVFKDVPIDDDDIALLVPKLRRCPRLMYLDLSGTRITDESMGELQLLPWEMRGNVYLDDTAVTDAGKLRLRKRKMTAFVK